MGKAKKPETVKLVIGMLAKNPELFDNAEEFFVKKFGPVDYRSPVIPFNYTDYYNKEIGYPLKREFISFKKPVYPQKIAAIKLLSNRLEDQFSLNQKRRINIDPGYISDAKFVLATTKDYSHRIYLNNGIYAEVTLVWRKSGFTPLEWTYPDYRSSEYIKILNTIRNTHAK